MENASFFFFLSMEEKEQFREACEDFADDIAIKSSESECGYLGLGVGVMDLLAKPYLSWLSNETKM